MHGTHVAGRRLRSGITERVYEGDKIMFGAEVARGDGKIHRAEQVLRTSANSPNRHLLPNRS